jgi:methylated-DNA-[protein]-cysteine S-methyltransferase
LIATIETGSGTLWISGNTDAIEGLSWQSVEGTHHKGELNWILAALELYLQGRATSFPGNLVFRNNRTLWARESRNIEPGSVAQKILCAIEKIPYSATMTYGDVAASVKNRNWARAVGAVCRANPLPLLVPCHRVVGKTSLGGYSGGLHHKRFLLRLEGSLKENFS